MQLLIGRLLLCSSHRPFLSSALLQPARHILLAEFLSKTITTICLVAQASNPFHPTSSQSSNPKQSSFLISLTPSLLSVPSVIPLLKPFSEAC